MNATSDKGITVKGTYSLAVLLQELFFAKQRGEKYLETSLSQLEEDPVHRLERFIRYTFWDTLTRQMNAKGIAAAAPDPKTVDSQPRIYIPAKACRQFEFYTKIAVERPELRLDVQWLPAGEVDAKFIQSINSKPGILALATEEIDSMSCIIGTAYSQPPGGCWTPIHISVLPLFDTSYLRSNTMAKS